MVERLVTLAGVAAGRLCYPCSFLGMAMCDAPAGRLLYRLGALIRMRRRWFRVTTKLSFRVRTILSLCIPSTAELPTHEVRSLDISLAPSLWERPHAEPGARSGFRLGRRVAIASRATQKPCGAPSEQQQPTRRADAPARVSSCFRRSWPVLLGVHAGGIKPMRTTHLPHQVSRRPVMVLKKGIGLDTPPTGPNTLRTGHSRGSRHRSMRSARLSSSFPSGSGFRYVRFRRSTSSFSRTSIPQPSLIPGCGFTTT